MRGLALDSKSLYKEDIGIGLQPGKVLHRERRTTSEDVWPLAAWEYAVCCTASF